MMPMSEDQEVCEKMTPNDARESMTTLEMANVKSMRDDHDEVHER
jgi:hypothetical protein